MPDWTMVESWRVAIDEVVGLDLLEAREDVARRSASACSSMSTTISPRPRSCEATACWSFASISPLVVPPERSRALNA